MKWRLKKLQGDVTITVGGEPTDLGTCLICGCLVPTVRERDHQDWHNSLATQPSGSDPWSAERTLWSGH